MYSQERDKASRREKKIPEMMGMNSSVQSLPRFNSRNMTVKHTGNTAAKISCSVTKRFKISVRI